MNDRMPALYIGHGAPPLLDDPLGPASSPPGRRPPRPKAILIVSAHWESAPVSLSRQRRTPGLRLRRLRREVLPDDLRDPGRHRAGRADRGDDADDEPVHQHASRGLDHGAWVPLKIMYPAGDVPVLQMSLPTQDPVRLMRLGERLRPLRDEGVLIIGSGFLTHGLPFLTRVPHRRRGPRLVDGLRRLGRRRAGPRRRRRARGYRPAPGMPYAHPTVEHYTPLFVTLGAATDPEQPGLQVIDGFWMGLSKRCLQVA